MTVASPMRNGQESELDRLLAMMLMDEDRLYAQTAARRVPFTQHRPPREELINGHARRRMPPACRWEPHARRYSPAHNPAAPSDAPGLPAIFRAWFI